MMVLAEICSPHCTGGDSIAVIAFAIVVLGFFCIMLKD
jgi:hypothetical protein